MGSRSDQVSLGKLCCFCLDMFKGLPDDRWSSIVPFHQSLRSLLSSVEQKCSFCIRMLQLTQRCNGIDMQQGLKLSLSFEVEHEDKSKSSNIRRLLRAGQKHFQKGFKKFIVYNDKWESNDITGLLCVSVPPAPSVIIFKEFRLATITSFEG
jgi:hypothetical protein